MVLKKLLSVESLKGEFFLKYSTFCFYFILYFLSMDPYFKYGSGSTKLLNTDPQHWLRGAFMIETKKWKRTISQNHRKYRDPKYVRPK